MISTPSAQQVAMVAVLVLAAPLFSALRRSFAALLEGRSTPWILLGYRRLAGQMFARSLPVARTATPLRGFAPAAALAAAVLSASTLARIIAAPAPPGGETAITFVAWLFTARVAATLAAVDPGGALNTLAHARSRVVSVLVEPALLLALLASGSSPHSPLGPHTILAALAFIIAAWTYGETRGEAGDLGGPGLALTVWSQDVTQISLWSAWAYLYTPIPRDTGLGAGAAVLALFLISIALGAIDAHVVRSGMTAPRHAPFTALAFAVVALLASAFLAGVATP